ncbi:winged helix-turn-helix domain-containing protein [Pseudoroseomonas wenyumeiae]
MSPHATDRQSHWPEPAPLRDPRRLSLSEQVTRDLDARITQGELRPGDRLPTERELMARYGVSRTVVREAMSSLRAAGRLATQQGRGAFVLEQPVPGTLAYRLHPSEADAAGDMLALMEIASRWRLRRPPWQRSGGTRRGWPR